MERAAQESGRSRPIISDTRRAQIRQAQKSYHARKKINFESLEARASSLEETTHQMCDIFLDLNDKLLGSANFRHNPGLVSHLQGALQRTVSLASRAIPDDDTIESNEAAGSASQSPLGTQSQSPTDSLPEKDRRRGPYSRPMSPSEESSELPPLAIALNPLHESEIPTRHPLAAIVFPATERWTEFSRRLRWGAIKLGFTSLLGKRGQMLPLAQSMFRFALPFCPREALLENFCYFIEYEARGPALEDGTVILKPGPLCIQKWTSRLNAQLDSRSVSDLIHRFLQNCWVLHERICEVLVSSGADPPEYLEHSDVEEYLYAQGARFRPDGYVELPPSAAYPGTQTQSLTDISNAAAHHESTQGEETQIPGHRELLGPSWLLHQDYQPNPDGGKQSSSTSPEKLFWMEPRVVFPDASESSHPSVMPTAGGIYQRRLLSRDQMIDTLNRQSIYVGCGSSIPTFAIDSTISFLTAV